jgi:hypothetical protein
MIFKELTMTSHWGSAVSTVTRQRFGQTRFNFGKCQEQLFSLSQQDQFWGPTRSPVARPWGLNEARACSWPQRNLIYIKISRNGGKRFIYLLNGCMDDRVNCWEFSRIGGCYTRYELVIKVTSKNRFLETPSNFIPFN